MWRSDQWKDYELIDCGRGEKLERWGDQLLVRPDPQAIWNTPRTHRGWKQNAGRYARSSSGGGQWQNCHVDAARGMVSWARENARSSHLEDAPIRWIVDDCAKFVEREIRRGRRYDAIIMDPPSYGRGPSGEVWRLEENLYPFVELVSGVLSDDPLFIVLNSYTTGLAPSVLTYILETLISKRFGGHTVSDELGLPVTQSGLVLPCGATGRWTSSN